jgi:hypothetical protein
LRRLKEGMVWSGLFEWFGPVAFTDAAVEKGTCMERWKRDNGAEPRRSAGCELVDIFAKERPFDAMAMEDSNARDWQVRTTIR